MGTITVTRDTVVNALDNQLPLVARFAGAGTNINPIYDPVTETLTVEGVSDLELQDAVNNFQTHLSAWQATEDSIETKQIQAKATIDQYAGLARTRFITSAPGQELTYQEKAEEAADYVAAGYPSPPGSPPILADYPFIQAEVDATGKTHAQAADDILAQKSSWIAAGSLIEKHRLSGKSQIDAATTSAEIDQIVSDAIAALQNV